MLLNYYKVTNFSGAARELVDPEIPGGRVTIPPGAEYPVSRGTYHRNFRKCSSWLRAVGRELGTKEAPSKALKAIAAAGRDGESDGLGDLKLKELKEIGAELSLPYKPGTKTDDYREAIRAKIAEAAAEGPTEEVEAEAEAETEVPSTDEAEAEAAAEEPA